MKRTLVVLTVLMVLSALPLAAFAAEPDQAPAILLGDQMTFDLLILDPFNDPAPFFPVDISLYRPDTTGGWPWLNPPPTAGTWVAAVDESAFRRQSYPAFQSSNAFGIYQAKFMLPRENTWYPCGYPCRWQCDFYDGIADTWERHGPVSLVALQTLEEFVNWPLYWPNEVFGDPIALDVMHPLEAWAFEGDTMNALGGGQWPYEVWGYYWKSSDLEVDYPADWPDICPWMVD